MDEKLINLLSGYGELNAQGKERILGMVEALFFAACKRGTDVSEPKQCCTKPSGGAIASVKTR